MKVIVSDNPKFTCFVWTWFNDELVLHYVGEVPAIEEPGYGWVELFAITGSLAEIEENFNIDFESLNSFGRVAEPNELIKQKENSIEGGSRCPK